MSTKSINGPTPKKGIMDIHAYVPGKSGAKIGKVFKLSSNESALGASPKATAAFTDATKDLALYPDGSALALREAIAKRHGLKAQCIICGTGSDELLQLFGSCLFGAGR